jgi:GABA permease
MPWTTNLLVIANRTVDSEELLQTLRARAAAGPIRVVLVVPGDARQTATARRLERAIERLQAEQIPVEGVVGHPDPLVAVEDVWDPRRFDEVIVATLPTDVSRWMALDLPRRIARFTGARVSHVVASAGSRASARASA